MGSDSGPDGADTHLPITSCSSAALMGLAR